MHVYTYVNEHMYTYFCVCVWPNIFLCRKAFKQLFCLPTSLLARIYSGLGSMKYLQDPKRPIHTHTCILGVKKKNKKKTHSVTMEVKSTATAELSKWTKKKKAVETFDIEAEAKTFWFVFVPMRNIPYNWHTSSWWNSESIAHLPSQPHWPWTVTSSQSRPLPRSLSAQLGK